MSYAATASWWFEGGRHYTKQGYLDHAKGWTADAASAPLRGRHIAVTGANAGLGFALSEELAWRDATVHLACRIARAARRPSPKYAESTRTRTLARTSSTCPRRRTLSDSWRRVDWRNSRCSSTTPGLSPERSCTPQRATRFLWQQQWAEAFCSRLCSCRR